MSTQHSSEGRSSRSRAKREHRFPLRELIGLLAGEGHLVIAVAVLSLLAAGASLAQPLMVSTVIEQVERGEGVVITVWLLVGLVVVAGVLSAFQQYALQRMGEAVVLATRERLIRKLFRMPIHEYDFRRTGDLVSRLSSDSTLLRVALTQGLVAAMSGVVTFLGALVAMAIIDLLLLGVTLGVVVCSFAVVTSLGSRIEKTSTRVQASIGALTAAAERVLNAVRTVRAANATTREEEEVLGHARDARIAGLRLAKIAAFVSPISGIAMQASFLAVLGIGGYRVASGSLSIADLVAFILFLFMMVMPLSQAFEAVTAVSQALGGYRRVQEIVKVPSEDDADDLSTFQTRQEGPFACISFRDVSFEYPAQEAVEADAPSRPVLDGISFDVGRGERLALVGPSGAGKSTILQLIERFYEPSEGCIYVDGINASNMRREDLRAMIGYVEQDAPVLAGTIRTNLTLAAPNATDEDCLRVLSAVNLLSLVERSRHGLNAEVGHDGVTLSGGEKQRLAIARSLIAEPPILLLDESTSSLDSKNEQAMRVAIDSVAENRTLVVVAHRLSTVLDADKIIVVDRGEIVGVGTHDQLLDTTPLYRSLAKHQLLA